MMLNPAAEVLLSYLTGLAPVGETIEPRLGRLMADLDYGQKVSIYRGLNQLIRAGCVKKLAAGADGTIGVLVVAKRLEALPSRHLPKNDPCCRARAVAADDGVDDEGETGPLRAWGVDRVSREDRDARLAEIPEDTRGLTARVLGDPIPGDPRRRRLDRTRARPVSLCKSAGAALESERKAIA